MLLMNFFSSFTILVPFKTHAVFLHSVVIQASLGSHSSVHTLAFSSSQLSFAPCGCKWSKCWEEAAVPCGREG